MAQLSEGLGLDLADAFPGDVELLADLLQGAGAAVLNAEAQLQHLLLPGGEGREDLYQLLLQQGEGGGLRRLAGVLIGDEVAQMAVLLLADGGLQGDGLLGDLQDLTHPLHRHGHLLGDLLGGGVVAQLLEQLAGDADDLVDGLHHVDGDADGAGLVGDGPGDGLADPPGGIGGELIALGVVELLHRFDQAQIALLDQVQKLHPAAHIPLGDGHHQTQVGLGQALLGPLALLNSPVELSPDFIWDLLASGLQLLQLGLGGVARVHSLGQLDLLLRGQQVDLADLLQIHPYRVIGAEGVHHGVGVHHLLLVDLLHGLQRGICVIGEVGDIVLAHGIDAQVFQGVIDLVHLIGLQIHVLQDVHQLGGGEVALLLTPLDQLSQLFCAGDALYHLHDLHLASLHTGLHLRSGGLVPVGLLLQDHGYSIVLGLDQGGIFFLFGTHGFSSIYAFFSKLLRCAARRRSFSLAPLRLMASARITAM